MLVKNCIVLDWKDGTFQEKECFNWAISKFNSYCSMLLQPLSSPRADLFSERFIHKARGEEVLIFRILKQLFRFDLKITLSVYITNLSVESVVISK